MRAKWFRILLSSALVAFWGVLPAQAADAPQALSINALLTRDAPVSFSITDATLPGAIEALKEQTGVVARVQGAVREAKITLSVRETPVRDLLDALAAAYGTRWERRLTMIVFIETRPASPRAARQVTWSYERLDEVLQALRAAGIGAGPRAQGPRSPSAPAFPEGVFLGEQLKQMAQAGPAGARRFGTRIADLDPDSRQRLLGWLQAMHDRRRQAALSTAMRPFEPERYLNATLYASLQGLTGQKVPGLGVHFPIGPVVSPDNR